MNIFTVLLPIATLLMGAVATFVADSVRHRRSRRESIQDSLNAQRTTAYVSFLESAHSAAHLLGRSAPGCPNPLSPNPDQYWLIDSEVTHRLRSVELIGSDGVISAAHDLRDSLRGFRDVVSSQSVKYASEEYWAAYQPVRRSRDALVALARADLLSAS